MELCKRASRYNIHAIEQPLPRASPLEEWARLREMSEVPIMVDESLVTVRDAEELIAAKACDFFCLKVSKCGGIYQTLRIARLATSAGIRLVLGRYIGDTALLGVVTHQVGAYLENVEALPGLGNILSEDIVEEEMGRECGRKVPAVRGAGLGVSVRQDVIEKYATRTIVLGGRN
jgi:muconate cycloisomerase